MVIDEPCNYASNIAFYHATMRFCDYPEWNFNEQTQIAFKRSMATLAPGSSFMHASHTKLGTLYDNSVMAMIAFLGYRSILEKLGGGGSSNILNCLRDTDCIDQYEVADRFTFLSLNAPVSDWLVDVNQLNSEYQFDYFYTFAAIVLIVFKISLPEKTFISVFRWLLDTFVVKIVPEAADFIENKFYPEIKPLLDDIHLSFGEAFDLQRRFFGVFFLKFIWAFLW